MKLSITFLVVIALSLIAIACAFLGLFSPKHEPGLTIVAAPKQDQPLRPECFPNSEENYIPMPETANLAEGKPISAGEHTDVYVNSNVNNRKTDTYWESKGFPAEIPIDLEGSYSISTVAVRLNPSAVWEAKTQEIAVLVSNDGEDFTELIPATKDDFDPNTSNRIRMDFDSVQAGFVKLVFTMNSSYHTGGAQAAEIEVYE